MSIGSKVIGSSVVAGQYGIIQAQTQVVSFSQTVQLVDPAQTLATFEQSVWKVDKAKTLAVFTQRVIDSSESIAGIFVPYGYVELNGILLTCETPTNNIRVTHNEDQSSTASMNVTYPTGIQINIPSFHGKPVRVLVHEDPNSIESELIPLFTGWVESARHDLATQSIDFTCSDLRDERLGREDGQSLKSLTGGLYSTVTQREDVSGREYVTELMKTVSGSLGYTRSGDLRYHSWGVTGKPIDLTLGDADVAYDDLTTEFQTRSSIKNAVKISIGYRWSRLWRFTARVGGSRNRLVSTGTGSFMGTTYKIYNFDTFSADSMIDRAYGFSPWETLFGGYTPATYVFKGTAWNVNGPGYFVTDEIWRGRALGFSASLVRRVAQPISEEYEIKVRQPESILYYDEEIEGSALNFSIDTDYDKGSWEGDDFKEKPFRSDQARDAAIARERASADNRRDDLSAAWNAAIAIARKEIAASHRQSFVSCKLHRIEPMEIGDIVQHDNRMVQTVGQCVGVEYTIADGLRETSIRTAINYMDIEQTTTEPEITIPIPNYSGIELSIDLGSGSRSFSLEDGLRVTAPEIPEQYTDEQKPNIDPVVLDIPVDINPITLVNGY